MCAYVCFVHVCNNSEMILDVHRDCRGGVGV